MHVPTILDSPSKPTASKPWISRRKKLSLILGAIALVAVGTYYTGSAMLSRYLESGDLRSRITRHTAKVLGAPSAYQSLSWRGISVFSEGFRAEGKDTTALTALRARSINARSNIAEVWHGKWRIETLTLEHLEAAYGSAAATQLSQDFPPGPPLEPPAESESPFSLDIRHTSIARTDLHWGAEPKTLGSLRDVATNWYPIGKDLVVHGEGGTLTQFGFPELVVKNFKLYYAKPSLRIDEGSLTVGKTGLISVGGQFIFDKPGTMDVRLGFLRCPITPFLPKDSRSKLSGTFAGEARLQKKLSGEASVASEGQFAFSGAVLQSIDALQKVAAFTGKREFSRLTLEELRGDFHSDGETTTIKDLELEARGLLRVEGYCTMQKQSIRGTLKVGTTAAVLASFPGAREAVFTEARGDYFWTTVKVSGSMKEPHNDLKPRLVSAAKRHFAKKLLAPLLKPGKEVIEQIDALF
jgi:hypothetical protein